MTDARPTAPGGRLRAEIHEQPDVAAHLLVVGPPVLDAVAAEVRRRGIGLVVIAIAALVAAIVYAWNNSETFRSIVIGAWEAVKTAVVAVVDWFKTAVPAAFEWVKNAFLTYTPLGFVISHWSQIRDFIGSAVDRIKSIIG